MTFPGKPILIGTPGNAIMDLGGGCDADRYAQEARRGCLHFAGTGLQGGNVYNKILVPLDGSRDAEAILRHVEDLALRFGSKVVFLRTVEPPSPVSAAEMAYANLHRREYERRVRDDEQYLSVQQGKFRERGIETTTHVSAGPAAEGILRVAEREDVDLVAMASSGRRGLSGVLVENVAAGVLQRISRPLLVVRP